MYVCDTPDRCVRVAKRLYPNRQWSGAYEVPTVLLAGFRHITQVFQRQEGVTLDRFVVYCAAADDSHIVWFAPDEIIDARLGRAEHACIESIASRICAAFSTHPLIFTWPQRFPSYRLPVEVRYSVQLNALMGRGGSLAIKSYEEIEDRALWMS